MFVNDAIGYTCDIYEAHENKTSIEANLKANTYIGTNAIRNINTTNGNTIEFK